VYILPILYISSISFFIHVGIVEVRIPLNSKGYWA
jgi:hypothetical protein